MQTPAKDFLLDKLDKIKAKAINSAKEIELFIQTIINQQEIINELKLQNKSLEDNLVKLNSLVYKCRDYSALKPSSLQRVNTVMYAALPDFTQIYVDYNKSFTTPRGLVYNNLAAGVLVKSLGNYSLGYLILNKKVSFTVFIGSDEIPGIYKDGKIKFIPKFKKITPGDVVITSGLDKIFYKGALVGKVSKITQKKLYQEATISLFYDKLNPNYFYVYEGAGNGYVKH